MLNAKQFRLGVCLAIVFPLASPLGRSSEPPVSVLLSRSCAKGLAITIGSVVSTQANLLKDFGDIVRARGGDATVLVLAEKSVAIKDLQELRAVAGKAGLRELRFFSFDPSRNLAAEIRLDMLGVPIAELAAGSAPAKP